MLNPFLKLTLKSVVKLCFAVGLFVICLPSFADTSNFRKGPVLQDFGENAEIAGGLSKPKEQSFKVLFDVSEQSGATGVNRSFNTVARFINMHARAGVALENINAAIVVHGKASFDLMSNEAFEQRFDKENPNVDLIKQLVAAGTQIILCGQSAEFSDISTQQLLPKVSVSLSAMTANALLQQQGYTLNPF